MSEILEQQKVIYWVEKMIDYSEYELLVESSCKSYNPYVRLAAALILCTCDSNERKAGE